MTTASNYDPFGRLDTLTVAGEVVQRYRYDGFDRIAEQQSLGTETSTTRSRYDPLDRTIERIDDAGTAEAETTSYEYLGTSGDVAAELVDGTLDRTYQYGPGGLRLSMQTHDDAGAPQEASYYSYNPHADVVAITDEVGDTRTTYGYTAYGKPDLDLFTGVDAPDPGNPDAEPYNIYRFNAMRVDTATGNYDMGFRNYSPQDGRFLTRDMYNGALSDLGMTTSPWTQNRYAFGAGNPISRIENDGHCWGFLSSACDAVGGAVSDAWNATTDWWSDTAQPWLEENIIEPVQEGAEAAAEAVGDAAEAVGDAAEATVDFIEEHKAEIAGIVAGIAITAGCLVITGGAGSIGCAALGGAVGAGLTGYMNGQRGLELVGTIALGAAAGALGGAAGALVGRGIGVLASRAGTSKLLANLTTRARQVHSVLKPIEQRKRTTAALGTTQGRTVLAGGVRDLNPAQRALAQPGELLGRLPGAHAEITAMSRTAEAGLTPRAIATTTNICPACQAALEGSGATVIAPRLAIWGGL